MDLAENKKMSPGLMNKINKKQVLAVIRNEEQISRAEIGRRLGLTPPTVNRILEQLIELGFVEYVGHGKSGGGRPPMIVKFNGKNNYVIGIDIGATAIRGVLSNLDAEFILEIQLSTQLKGGEQAVLEQIFVMVDRLLARKNLNGAKVHGIGIGVPGLIDTRNGMVDLSPDFGWKKVEFHKRLSERISLPILFDNSTRLMAVGEKKYGKGVLLDDYLVINVGYGIAAGIVVNGKILAGAKGHAGEFGHIVIDPHSNVICDCGGMGHLEALASGRRIADMGKALIAKDPALKKASEGKVSNITAKMIAALAKEGNKNAINIFDTALNYLSLGIVNMINVFDPKKVFIGGGVALNGDIFFKKLNKKVAEKMMSTKKMLPIEPVTFGENATLVGACALVLEGLLNFDISLANVREIVEE